MAVTTNNDVYRYLDETGEVTAGQLVTAYPPPMLMTNDGGDYARIRVDVAQTGFFAGTEFRTFRRLSIAAGASLVIRAVVPIDVILFQLALELVDGWVDVETVTAGTPGGSFSETLPIFRRNNMSVAPVVVPQVVLTAGGTHTGGTVLDVLAARASGATAQASSVGNHLTDERGIAPGTYYFRLTNPGSGTATGVFRAWWEERV
jgi:hypothetical protein